MNLESGFNKLLTRIFGTYPTGDRRVWFHSQNLNEDHRGKPKGSALRHGRCWLHFTKMSDSRRDHVAHVEWVLGGWRFHNTLSVDPCELGVLYSFAIPGIALYLGVDGVTWKWLWKLCDNGRGYGDPHSIGIRIFSSAIWWSLWENEHQSSSRDPWWQRGNIHLDDFFLGKRRSERTKLEEKDVVIPLPEGSYPAHCTLEKMTFRRPRWFTETYYFAKIEVPQGIPHEGKGENSWDCGEDRTYGISCPAKTYEEAIGTLVESVLRDRRKYDGNLLAVYPPPKVVEEEGA